MKLKTRLMNIKQVIKIKKVLTVSLFNKNSIDIRKTYLVIVAGE